MGCRTTRRYRLAHRLAGPDRVGVDRRRRARTGLGERTAQPGERQRARVRDGCCAGGDLLVEDPGDSRGLERVELGVQGLADGGGAGVSDPHVPGRLPSGDSGAGQLHPGRSGLVDGGGGDVEGLGQVGHEPEPDSVVLDGHLAFAGPAWRPGGHLHASFRAQGQIVRLANCNGARMLPWPSG
jgi:hypothetical protein